MEVLRIAGGRPLVGTVAVSGSKNAALPMMAASLLAEEPVLLENVPRVRDVRTLGCLLHRLGLHVAWKGGNTLQLCPCEATSIRADYRFMRRMRASFCVLGPLLARRGRAIVPLPGGCKLGDRPVDLHLRGLAALGAELWQRNGYIEATADRLRGTKIDLAGPRGPTVTGTANVMSAAVLARGETLITSAACEPEIIDLARFLIAMGARIEGLGTAEISVRGVDELSGANHSVIPDRIEAATLLTAGASTGGDVTVSGARADHLDRVLDCLWSAGMDLRVDPNYVRIVGSGRPGPLNLSAMPYPGLPTDAQATLTALATLATGTSYVTDNVFPERFAHVPELVRMGADIKRRGNSAIVCGVKKLSAAPVVASDLRGSAALVLAGLAAEGTTTIHQPWHLNRGYERLDEKLNRLGAKVERVSSRAVAWAAR